MSTLYTIASKKGLTQISPEDIDREQFRKDHAITVEIYTPEEFASVDLGDDDMEEALLLLSHSKGSYANVLPECIIGSLSFPRKDNLDEDFFYFGFYVNPERLIFIDPTDACKNALESLRDLVLLPLISPLRILFEFAKEFITDDALFLNELEEKLGNLEDEIIAHNHKSISEKLLLTRRILMNYDRLYQQLTDFANIISKDEYLVFSKDDRRLFRLFEQRAERLFQRSQYLKEYSMQLHELYQMQIGAQQNKTIQWLTVVTTLVVPLTLLTSWYGMNFRYMPELEWEFGYIVVIALSILLVIVELIFFKKRKWL